MPNRAVAPLSCGCLNGGFECEEILSKSFFWKNNVTFGVLNLKIGKNYEEIFISFVIPDQLGYLENFVLLPLIGKDCCMMHVELEWCFVKGFFFFLNDFTPLL